MMMINHKILIICGKSCAGKDLIKDLLVKNYGFTEVVSHTTRPMRDIEVDGKNYYFVSDGEFETMANNDKFIEYRIYNTSIDNKMSVWRYGISRNEFANTSKKYICIVDINGLKDLIKYFGRENIISFYLDVDDLTRLSRCIDRGDYNHIEWERRLVDDDVVFASETLAKFVDFSIPNYDKDDCVKNILQHYHNNI